MRRQVSGCDVRCIQHFTAINSWIILAMYPDTAGFRIISWDCYETGIAEVDDARQRLVYPKNRL